MHVGVGETVERKERAPWYRRLTRRRAPLRPALREAIWGYFFVSPWIIGLIVFTLFPMIAAVGLGFFRTDLLKETRYIGLKWYGRLLTDTLVRKAFINTAYYVFASVPIRLVLSLMIAILLNQGIVGQSVWRTVYYLPSIVSGVAVSVLWFWLLQPDAGLINGLLAKIGIQGPRWVFSEEWAMPSLIIVSLWGVGGGMLIYLAGLQGIPTALYDAAKIDGAGTIARFFHVTIPMLTPTIFFNLVMGLIGSWQVFTQAFVMTEGGPNNATLTAVLLIYRTGFQQRFFGYASAQAVGLFVVILAFVIVGLKSAGGWVYYERV